MTRAAATKSRAPAVTTRVTNQNADGDPSGECASVRRGTVTLYSARLRVPSASLDLLAGSYLVQFGVRGALIGSPLRLRIGTKPRRANAARLRLAALSEVAIGEQTTLVVSGTAGVESLRVPLSPLPGGGSCCGISVADGVRRLDAERIELRFAWPRTMFRCAGVGQCSRVPWGPRGRTTVASEPVGDIVARDVVIRRGPAVLPVAGGPPARPAPIPRAIS